VDIDWIINHLGEERERYHGAVAPPLLQTSIFAFADVASMRAAAADEYGAHMYTRGNNPTVGILRKKLAALEGAEDCLVFASGAAAMAAGVVASVRAGGHVVCVKDPYGWTSSLLGRLLAALGISTDFVDGAHVAHIAAALRAETQLIVLESPSSLTFELQDLVAVAVLARERGIRTICDNSYASPLNQSPLALGIDMVMHSGTKYLNGHSDVMAGALCGSELLMREVFEGPYMTFGALLSPHDAWLMLRGLRTLPLRMQRVAATTTQIVDFLDSHPKVARLWYPHARSHPQFALAQRQMKGASGLLSIALDCPDTDGVERFCDALQRFLISVSWGGYESLVWPLASGLLAHTSVHLVQNRPASLVRLSIGLEEPDVLIADLAQALDKV
jgi:cystathionine beta-lyase/cystathionine gamma-synthase